MRHTARDFDASSAPMSNAPRTLGNQSGLLNTDCKNKLAIMFYLPGSFLCLAGQRKFEFCHLVGSVDEPTLQVLQDLALPLHGYIKCGSGTWDARIPRPQSEGDQNTYGIWEP
eukprot:9481031-Pyramimonas_sp.AAC.1